MVINVNRLNIRAIVAVVKKASVILFPSSGVNCGDLQFRSQPSIPAYEDIFDGKKYGAKH